MSALQERPETTRQTRPRVVHRKKATTQVQLRARIVRQQKPNIARFVGLKCVLFGLVLGGSWMVSSFCGQVLLEGARQQKLQAMSRAHDAKQAEEGLTAKLNEVKSIEGIETWALAHGFQAPDAQRSNSKMEGLVARR